MHLILVMEPWKKNMKGLSLAVEALIMTDFKTIFATPKISFGFNV